MLPVPFTFSGRIGRWGYFKTSVALTVSAIIPVFLALTCYDGYRAGNTAAIVGGLVLVATYGLAFLWICLAVTVRRIRDIGWSPALVVAIWIAVQLLDPVIAHLFPALAGGRHGVSTPIGGAVHLILSLALIFWPSTSRDVGGSDKPSASWPPNMPRSRVEALRASAPPVAASPARQVASVRPAVAVFGRR